MSTQWRGQDLSFGWVLQGPLDIDERLSALFVSTGLLLKTYFFRRYSPLAPKIIA